MMDLFKPIKRIINNEYAFSIVAKIVGVLAGVAYSILYSRYLQTTLRGTASVLTTYSDLGILVLCFGVYQGYPFFRKKKEGETYREFINLVFGFVFLYILLGIAFILIFRPSVNVCIITALIPFGIGTKELNYAVMIERPRDRNISAILLSLFEIALIVFFILFIKVDFTACVSILLINAFVCFVVAIKRLRINIFSIRPTLKGALPYIKFGILPMFTVIMMEINYKADVVFLEWFHITKAEIGIYTLGVSLSQRIWMIPDALKDILLSKLAKGRTKDEVCKVTRVSLLVVLLFVMGMIALGKPFINIFYGQEYASAYPISVILMLGIIGMVFYKTVYSYNVTQGERLKNLLLLGIAAVSNIIMDIIFIPRLGMFGAALASTVSYVTCGLCYLIDFCHKTKTKYGDMLIVTKKDLEIVKSLFHTG